MAYKCDRCGVLFDRDFEPEITVCHQNSCIRTMDLCQKCQKELEEWFRKIQFDGKYLV